MAESRAAFNAALVVATAVLLAGCGGKSSPDSASVAPESPAQSAPTTAPVAAAVPASTLTSDEVCALLPPDAVQAILGANPNPTPQQQPPGPGVSSGQCVWDAGGSQGDLTLTVMQALDGPSTQMFAAMPMEGDAVSGLGDEAGVTVQGNYNVEVMVRIGPRILSLAASAVGVAAKKDAVLAAARAAVAKLG